MADTPNQQPSKPGTACIGCRRRKLKCTREPDGCSKCLKSDLPCVYPAPESGVKRKRGPYKKDKPPRERHLEDLVKYLEPRAANLDNHEGSRSPEASSTPVDRTGPENTFSTSPDNGAGAARPLRLNGRTTAGNSEDLVKDALIALTQSATVDRESIAESGATLAQMATKAPNEQGSLGQHPPVRRIFDYWHLFVSRVDVMTKIIHCPTFARTLFASLDNLRGVGPATQALMFAIYYAAVSTCTAREARRRFNDSKDVLLQRYGRTIEATLADNYGMPEMESLQAILIYITAIRREDNITNVRALFSLGVRMAQLMGLSEDPGDSYPPLEVELRRRLWWHICGLESRGAEEGASRTTSIMQGTLVKLPANLFDFDLHRDAKEKPQPRVGITDLTFTLIRFAVIRMIRDLVEIRAKHAKKKTKNNEDDLKTEQRKILEEHKKGVETQFLRYLDQSRPYDWMCIRFIQTMMIKARLIIDHPFGQVPTKEMSPEERFDLLQASVDIIAFSHNIEVTGKKGTEPWVWYVRGWTQWHSLAIVISELGQCTNKYFANHAWAVLDPILARWDKVYSMKREEPAWDHVNALIERARQMRKQHLKSSKATQNLDSVAPLSNELMAQSVDQAVPMTSNGEVGPTPQELYPGFNTSELSTQPYQPMTWDSQLPPTLPPEQVPFQTGCAPAMVGFEGDFGDFGTIEGLDNIDFSAFDAVFGDVSWDMSSQNTDWSMEGFNM